MTATCEKALVTVLVKTRSFTPSPLTSATTIHQYGCDVGLYWTDDWNVPSPLPGNIQTVPPTGTEKPKSPVTGTALDTAKSGMPSPVRSATTALAPVGPAPWSGELMAAWKVPLPLPNSTEKV